jgi:two-component system, NtrC family, response regulator
MEKLLIVDDNAEIRKQLKWGLGKDYLLNFAEERESALALFKKHHPPVVMLDLGLPPDDEGITEGFLALAEIIAIAPQTKAIVITGRGEREHALRAIQMGAYDFYSKPIDLAELKVMLKRAFHLADLENENLRLQALGGGDGQMSGIFGQCPRMQEVFTTIRKVASTDVPVLVLGESGTGKEMVARALHGRSLRASGAFIPINCGAIPENLLESELFGHEKGAFTGALARIRGKVEFAHEGTLFLDEIGEMPPSLQVKLLRFLQEKVIQRVGGREDVAVDTRIVAATNTDIMQAIAGGSFREDLYYRLGVISIALPPLRERGEDRGILANLFLRRFRSEFGKHVRGFSGASLQSINDYEWPGNVRELENKVKRAVVMADAAIIEPEDLGFKPVAAAAQQPIPELPSEFGTILKGMKLKEARGLVEKELIVAAMEREGGNISKAAESLGLTRPTFYDLLKKHQLFPSVPCD